MTRNEEINALLEGPLKTHHKKFEFKPFEFKQEPWLDPPPPTYKEILTGAIDSLRRATEDIAKVALKTEEDIEFFADTITAVTKEIIKLKAKSETFKGEPKNPETYYGGTLPFGWYQRVDEDV